MPTKTRDEILFEIGQSIGVFYDVNAWKNFAVKPEDARKLADAIDASGILKPVVPVDAYSLRLGPTFEELNPGANDTRPTLHCRPSVACDASQFGFRINPYEVAPVGSPTADTDYWTTVGQIGYIPDDPSDVGLARVQTFAYYNHAFAISPRIEGAIEPFTGAVWMNGVHVPCAHPICQTRNCGMIANEALVIYSNNVMAPAGTETARQGNEWPLPYLQFPAEFVPSGIALTTSNEFALVIGHNTTTGKGQVAVIALEAKYLPFHTWPWIAFPNQGVWSKFVLMGYIDLPFANPNSVDAASNGLWEGPSSTAGKVLSQIDITDGGNRWGLQQGEYGWQKIVASAGYGIISSKTDNQAVILDMSPLFAWVKNSYLDYNQQPLTIAAIQAGTFPGQLTAANTPVLSRIVAINNPTCVLAGKYMDRWSIDQIAKAYIATADGLVDMLDVSQFMARWDFEKKNTFHSIGFIEVGRNPTDMCFARFSPTGLPLMPTGQDGRAMCPDVCNSLLWVCCRGDRRIDGVVTNGGQAVVYTSISDTRLGDPVKIAVADRGNILTALSYNEKKAVSFRIGALVDRVPPWQNTVVGEVFPCGTPEAPAQIDCAGEVVFPGKPTSISVANLN